MKFGKMIHADSHTPTRRVRFSSLEDGVHLLEDKTILTA